MIVVQRMMRAGQEVVRHIPEKKLQSHWQLYLIDDFIDDETPVASGSGTQQHTSSRWNALQSDKDLDDFFARIYERSRSHRMRPTVEDDSEDTAEPHGCIRALPGDEEFPLWRIGCRVRLSLKD